MQSTDELHFNLNWFDAIICLITQALIMGLKQGYLKNFCILTIADFQHILASLYRFM